MDLDEFERWLLKEKQQRFLDAVKRTSKNLGVTPPKVKFWDGFCPYSNNEIAHIHIKERIICISNYWIKSLNFDEIDEVAVHETTHLIEVEHNINFYLRNSCAKENLWYSRNNKEIIKEEDIKDVRELALEKIRRKSKQNNT